MILAMIGQTDKYQNQNCVLLGTPVLQMAYRY